ncbi:MAG: hypothetical protein AAF353_20175 [Pseudomonadota bacterium]
MQVIVEFDDKSYSVEVPDNLPEDAQDYFTRIDQDMDRGWQMSRWWVPDPDITQRCQIVADKLLTALQQENREYAMLMCAYILRHKPETVRISLNTDGQIQGNQFL